MINIDLNAELTRYLSVRESLGVPIFQIQPILEKFVQYLNEQCQGDAIRASQVLTWVCNSENHSLSTRRVRLSAARVFLKHLRTLAPEIELPSSRALPPYHRPEPFVFTGQQLEELLQAASNLGSKKSIAPLTVQALLGLMACSGLRPGEAMRLKSPHVILSEKPPRLLILRTKFYKTRWVPLHGSAASRLQTYVQLCKQPDWEFFFSTKDGKQINRITLHRIFQELLSATSIRPRENQLRPTLHSLRHTFAVHRLQKWYQDGHDVRHLLPNLSVYLGHSDPASSYWYLSCTPQLMSAASQRFEKYGSKRRTV